jgi:CMP-N-acetylneuraminic acid synthetase
VKQSDQQISEKTIVTKPEILGIIPARGGSKGVKRKNLRLVAGRPLIGYTIDAARGASLLTSVVCSTEDDEIAKVARSMDCTVVARPVELADDLTPMKAVVAHVLNSLEAKEGYRPEAAVILQPTAPLRSSTQIDQAIEMLLSSSADAVVSVIPVPRHFHPEWQFGMNDKGQLTLWNGQPVSGIATRRQDLEPTYIRNGAVYAFKVSRFHATGSFYGERCLAYAMRSEDSINIDSEEDLQLADKQLSAGSNSY